LFTKVSHFQLDQAVNFVLVTASQIDPSLLPFLDARNAPEEAAALARLNTEQIEPTIRRGLGYKLRIYRPQGGQNLQRPEFEEIYNDIQLRLLKRLRALKEDPARNQIVNLRGYVATVTRNTCDEYLRQRYPLRRSLKDKVRRHLLTHDEFALWEDPEHNFFGGLSSWQNVDRARNELSNTNGELQQRLKTEWQTVDVQRLQLHDLLIKIFDVAQAPLELDHLTELVAEFWGIEDHAAEPLDSYTHAALDEQPAADINPVTIIERRQSLQLLWREICQLPRRQRVALLLNLRNPHGINVITLLPATGVATFEQIAQTLEIPAAEFEQLWSQLPLDDLHLADYLGATRQQVINLRRTARERLLKRMNGLKAR
jgi:DNA-directed RNA polymerase specialized sigma24 family protein